MTKFRIVVVVSILLSIILSSCNRNIAQSKEPKQYYYTCPMHPNDIYFLAGKCPKCGMELEAWEMDNRPLKKSSNLHSGHSSSGSSSGSGCH